MGANGRLVAASPEELCCYDFLPLDGIRENFRIMFCSMMTRYSFLERSSPPPPNYFLVFVVRYNGGGGTRLADDDFGCSGRGIAQAAVHAVSAFRDFFHRALVALLKPLARREAWAKVSWVGVRL